MATVNPSRFGHFGFHLPIVQVWILLALMPLSAAYPQAELASGLEECAALGADAERLACYDRLQRGEQQADDERSDAGQADVVTETVVTETDATEVATERTDTGAQVEPAAEFPITDTIAERSGSAADDARSAEPAEESSRRPFLRRLRDRLAGRGADRADSNNDRTASEATATRPDETQASETPAGDDIEVTVVDLRRNLSGLAVFLTEDNGTWVQISTRDRTYPDTPFSARITGGLMGGRFLTPESGGIAVRVRGPD